MRGYDIDGVLLPNKKGTGGNVVPKPPCVIISGRLFESYSRECRKLSQKYPVYIRGTEKVTAGRFKAEIINLLGITEFHEDSEEQANLIRAMCPGCKVIIH